MYSCGTFVRRYSFFSDCPYFSGTSAFAVPRVCLRLSWIWLPRPLFAQPRTALCQGTCSPFPGVSFSCHVFWRLTFTYRYYLLAVGNPLVTDIPVNRYTISLQVHRVQNYFVNRLQSIVSVFHILNRRNYAVPNKQNLKSNNTLISN